MSAQQLSPDAALRIGLAARALPDTDAALLMKVLVEALGLPLTEEKLGRLTVRELGSAADAALGDVPLPAMKQALDYLWGKAQVEVDEQLPTTEPYADWGMPGSIRVAVASNSAERLDGHFGSCARFLVYQVSPDQTRLVDIRSAAGGVRADDKNAERAAQIADCHVLMVVSIGGPAAAKVVKQDIHPIKFPNGGDARSEVSALQPVLGGTPPPWLAKVMGKGAEERVLFERTEEDA